MALCALLLSACSDDDVAPDAAAAEASVTEGGGEGGSVDQGREAGATDGGLARCMPPHWEAPTPRWGGPCRTAADCPSPDKVTTFCEPFTGGHCLEKGGPDFAGEGQPCSSDSLSVGVMIGAFPHCLAACSVDADCRPGYRCERGLGQSGNISACRPIADCATGGCNEGSSGLVFRCDEDNGASRCWVDACAGDPCAADPQSTGTCTAVADGRQCGCANGKVWDPACQRCDTLRCEASVLEVRGGDGSLNGSGDTCGLEARFDPTARGCTGWNEPGPEQLFAFGVPSQTVATVIATPITAFDLALYVLADCFDFEAQGCLGGLDMAGSEQVRVVNEEATEQRLYAVVDGAGDNACGEFSISVSFEAFNCTAIDLGTFDGGVIERLGESNCEGSAIYDPGFAGCTGGHAAGKEKVYRLTLAPQTSAQVTMELGNGFDAELYVIERCGDYNGASCGLGMGSDVGQFGVNESVVLQNEGTTAKTVYLVADSFKVFGECGQYDLRVEAAGG